MATTVRIHGRLNTTLLAEAVAVELGISHEEGARTVQAVLDVITRAVTAGHPVAVTNFGTWIPVRRPGRLARNPQTGEAVPVPPRQEVFFRVAPRLAELVRAEDQATASIRKNPKTPKAA